MSDEEVCGVEDDAGKTKSANEEDEEDEEDVLMERKVDADDASVDAEDDIVERRARTTTTSSELEDLERKLSSKDFIMEPECLDHVKRYIASGGAPSTAIELLSENYRGYAAMTSLAAHWLKLTAPPKPGANTSPIKVSATVAGQRNGDGHERTPTGGILAANEPASGEKARGDGSANTSGGKREV
jgi:negative elongation factor C/D